MKHRSFSGYRRDLIEKSRSLRRRSTLPERLLWAYLKRRRLGCAFRRQRPIGRYIVDFCCPDIQLVIEVDGFSHRGRESYDRRRQRCLEEWGYTVLRFSNAEVCADPARVPQIIGEWIEASGSTAAARKPAVS